MRKFSKEELDIILKEHAIWLNTSGTEGKRANLSETDLSETDLRGVNFSETDLREADLSGADLRGAKLRVANLRGADLRESNLDFSCLPLWCGGLGAKVDEKLAKQFMYHALHYALQVNAPGVTEELLDWVNTFHKVPEVPKL